MHDCTCFQSEDVGILWVIGDQYPRHGDSRTFSRVFKDDQNEKTTKETNHPGRVRPVTTGGSRWSR